MAFSDHFSQQASDYAKYRPGYPPELFAWLKTLPAGQGLVWDVGTGNGQAAVELAQLFGSVVATDPSAQQIASAKPHPRVIYRVAPAEESDLKDASVDLVTIAQALHWFDLNRFYSQVQRVLTQGGAIVAWTYALNEVDRDIDSIVHRFYTDVVGPYWPPERAHVESGYRTLPFPFREIEPPLIAMRTEWSANDYLGYMRTWSATQRYTQANGVDPVGRVADPLTRAWGESIREVRWPLRIRAGRI
jgi:SAM-dependent methyltransferase